MITKARLRAIDYLKNGIQILKPHFATMHHSSDHKIRLKNSHVLQLLHFCVKQILLRLTILLCVTNVSSNRFITKPGTHSGTEVLK